jgi:hypothetical protein
MSIEKNGLTHASTPGDEFASAALSEIARDFKAAKGSQPPLQLTQLFGGRADEERMQRQMDRGQREDYQRKPDVDQRRYQGLPSNERREYDGLSRDEQWRRDRETPNQRWDREHGRR